MQLATMQFGYPTLTTFGWVVVVAEIIGVALWGVAHHWTRHKQFAWIGVFFLMAAIAGIVQNEMVVLFYVPLAWVLYGAVGVTLWIIQS